MPQIYHLCLYVIFGIEIALTASCHFPYLRFMFRQILSFLLLSIMVLVAACNPTKSAFSKGDYDGAIHAGAQKLHRKPDDVKTLQMVAEAYRLANERDFEEIRNWEQRQDDARRFQYIHNIYRRLEARQGTVRRIPKPRTQLVANDVFEFRDYTDELNETKQMAVAELYQSGLELLAKNNRPAAREAYAKFRDASALIPNYKDLPERLKAAKEAGTTKVLVTIQPQGNISLPTSLEQEISRIDVSSANTEWVEFNRVQEFNVPYHYFVEIEINELFVSPERQRETRTTEKANIEDGWEYKKNPDGSVVRDSSGNKIKVPVYREISATITTIEQSKEAAVRGEMRILEGVNGQLVAQDRLNATSSFSHTYARARGDSRAISRASAAALQRGPVAYPTHEQLLLQTASVLRNQMTRFLQNHRQRLP